MYERAVCESEPTASSRETIAGAAERWSCNKMTGLVKSGEFVVRVDERIRRVLVSDDLTMAQKTGESRVLAVSSYDERDVSEEVSAKK